MMPNQAPTEDVRGTLVEVRHLSKHFRNRRGNETIRAVDDVSFTIRDGECLGVVGESGSGKTTLARCIARLIKPTAGEVLLQGQDLASLSRREMRRLRSKVQVVFQDPYGSLNPRWTVGTTVEEPMVLNTELTADARRTRIQELLSLVRLDPGLAGRYPHQLSGGQQQRVGIARALATNPDLLLLDEPTSALDMLARRGILDLIGTLRRDLGLTCLFISHDLSAVRAVSDRIAVMYLGRVVEDGPADRVLQHPQHPYTRALLSAELEPRVESRRERAKLRGEPPSPMSPPPGCRLHPRCPIAVAECAHTDQQLDAVAEDHRVACMRVTRHEDIEWPAGWDADLTGGRGERRARKP
jgi:oligopeptide/dipeptide ABC transporter ATP-binding protein